MVNCVEKLPRPEKDSFLQFSRGLVRYDTLDCAINVTGGLCTGMGST
jgi:hypothetical protein